MGLRSTSEDWAATTKDLNSPVTLDSIVFLLPYTGITHGFGGILDPDEYYYLVITAMALETWYTEIFRCRRLLRINLFSRRLRR